MADHERGRFFVPRDSGRDSSTTEAIGVDDDLALRRREPRDLRVGRSEVDTDGAIEEGHGAPRLEELTDPGQTARAVGRKRCGVRAHHCVVDGALLYRSQEMFARPRGSLTL